MNRVVRLTPAEQDAIENAWIVAPQDGPSGDDDPMYVAVERIIAARLAAQEGERGGAEVAAAVEIDTPDREVVARIIDTEAFGQHALTWKPSPGDFPSNWQNRRDAAYRKADEIAALYSADPAGALATHDAEVLRAAAARFKSDAPLTAAYVRDCLNADAARIEAQP